MANLLIAVTGSASHFNNKGSFLLKSAHVDQRREVRGGMTSLIALLVALATSGLFTVLPAEAQSGPPPPQTVPSIGIRTPPANPPATVPSIGISSPRAYNVPSIGLRTPPAFPAPTAPSIGTTSPRPYEVPSIGIGSIQAYPPMTTPSIGQSTPQGYEVPSIGVRNP
jgi:hypothetical protein